MLSLFCTKSTNLQFLEMSVLRVTSMFRCSMSSWNNRGNYFQFVSRLTPDNVRVARGDINRLSVERHDFRLMDKAERQNTQLLWSSPIKAAPTFVAEPSSSPDIACAGTVTATKKTIARASRQILKKLAENTTVGNTPPPKIRQSRRNASVPSDAARTGNQTVLDASSTSNVQVIE